MYNRVMSASDVDSYINGFPSDTQPHLKKIREAIRKALPEAEETISYDMPAYVLNGKKLVWFGGFKSHVGFYPGAAAVSAFENDLASYTTAKGSVQFPLADPLPVELITRMVKFRLEQA